MDANRLLGILTLLISASYAGPGLGQLVDEEAMKAWGKGVDREVIAQLVANRTWKLDWSSCMGSTDCGTFWDFSGGGAVCARAIGATPDDQCADEGSWRIEDNTLCWELSWMGGGSGYKSVCILIKEIGDNTYEATRARGLGLTFFTFTLPTTG